MDFWFSEYHTDNVKMSIRVEKHLFSGQSDFQRIDVFDSHKQWMYGTWASNDWAIGFLFETCELHKYEVCNWYTTKDKTQLYVVVVEGSSYV